MRRVLLAQQIHPRARDMLQGRVDWAVAPSPEDPVVRRYVPGCAGLIVRTATRLSRETILAADALQVIARTGGGVDNVDVEAATERGIPVCHTPEANTETVAEHTLALILAAAKDLRRLDAAVRAGQWRARDDARAADLRGKALGLVGLGRIGSRLAALAACFGMKVLGHDPHVSALPDGVEGKKVRDLALVFRESDVVSFHVPLTEQTRGLVGAELLGQMKPTAILVNTSRGAVVDEAALAEALAAGRPAAAALDVFAEEPPPPESPLLGMENVILTPHTAALTAECRLRMHSQAVEGLLDVLEGRRPRWVANRAALRERGIET